ncbi:MAG: glycosyltransferase [Lachnospiraceae bacterium]|nr:glycosyltransferase [Lachnospiraceae bacterium]
MRGKEKEMTIRKIAVVGPVYPYKGGISHYTGLLVRALKKRYEVYTVSYKMQYPRLLFRKEQRDYENDSFKIEDAEFLINTANPFNISKCAGHINGLKPDLVIIQWWHPYFSPCYRILAKKLKAKVMFICHNVFPHERFPLDRALTKTVLKNGDFFILHSKKEADELLGIVKDAKYAINMHPTYSAFKMDKKDKDDTTSHEGLKLLFFGFVRPYKGLKILLKAMEALPDVVKLIVVGDFGGSRPEYDGLIEKGGLKERVTIREGYVPDKEVGEYFENCDAVVLPYIDATQSGIAQIAFGFEKPVIATNAGGLPEVVTDSKTGVLCEANDADSLTEAIKRFSALRNEIDFAANIKEDSGRFSWEHMVNTIGKLAES